VRIVLAAGGTGGHIEPALNVGDAIRRLDPSASVFVMGSERGLESALVPARGYELVTVPAVPLPRRPNGDLALLGPRLLTAVNQATRIMNERQVTVAVGFGGYAAVPAYLAARRTHTPLVIHEANATPGIANKLGARFTSHVYAVFPELMRGSHSMAVPLRSAISHLDRTKVRDQARAELGLDPQAPVLLVFGGSQGAARVNAALSGALPSLLQAGVQVVHAYGARNAAPASLPGYFPLAFIDRMDLAYAASDLALTRAGAMTCGELAAVGLPAIYVPLPIGNGEQRRNATPVVDAGGGLLVADGALTAEWLTETVLGLMHDGERLHSMSAAASGQGVRDADEQLARIVLKVGGGT